MRSVLVAAIVIASSVAAARKPPKKPTAKKQYDTSRKWNQEVPKDATTTPAYRYGAMTQTDCEAALRSRKIEFAREAPTAGVVAPVRLAGRLHGVLYKTDQPEAKRKTSPWEIGDCRLILALDDFSQILAAHDIVEVRHYSMYRRPDKGWPEGKPATRHNGALAIDAARFTKSDGSHLDVLTDYHGAIGDHSCGDKASAPHPATAEATELRAILCEAVAQHLFNVVLTPNYNAPHKNHFHLEVTAGWKAFIVE